MFLCAGFLQYIQETPLEVPFLLWQKSETSETSLNGMIGSKVLTQNCRDLAKKITQEYKGVICRDPPPWIWPPALIRWSGGSPGQQVPDISTGHLSQLHVLWFQHSISCSVHQRNYIRSGTFSDLMMLVCPKYAPATVYSSSLKPIF